MSTSQERPSAAAWAFASALVAGVAGYFLGQASSLGIFGASHKSSKVASEQAAEESSSDEEYEKLEGEWKLGDKDQDIQNFGKTDEECKLVLVVRTDLGMTKGTFTSLPSQ